jgi:hypothetical protein
MRAAQAASDSEGQGPRAWRQGRLLRLRQAGGDGHRNAGFVLGRLEEASCSRLEEQTETRGGCWRLLAAREWDGWMHGCMPGPTQEG